MKIIKREADKSIFPFIAYISDDIDSSPALIIQLHGAGERGNGSEASSLQGARVRGRGSDGQGALPHL